MGRPIPSPWPLLWRDAPKWPAWSDRPKQRRRHQVHTSALAYISKYLLSSFFGALWANRENLRRTGSSCGSSTVDSLENSVGLVLGRSALVKFPICAHEWQPAHSSPRPEASMAHRTSSAVATA